ncbi:MAG TPA: oligosaccharide flippase family protein [Lacunisphaera sp.]|nr:oligosaccharide flippase family protein [Lacunisphaera sp.]
MSQLDIGAKLKELLNHSVVYGLGSVLQSALGFVLIPIYTKNLTVEMYGAWSLITLAGTLAGVLFYLGASSALSRSFYDYQDLADRRKVVSTALLLTVGGALLQIGLGWACRGLISQFLFGNDQYGLHIGVALTSAAFAFVNGLFYVVLRFQRHSKAVVIVNVLTMLNGAGWVLYFLLVRRLGVLAPLLGEAVNQLLTCVVLAWLSRDLLGWSFSKRELRVQLAYGLPTVISGIAYYLFANGDRYFVQRFCDLSDVGVYSLGARIGMLIQVLLIMPFGQIWLPVRMELNNRTDAGPFFQRILTYYVMCGMLFALGLSLFAREIVDVLARDPSYLEAYRAVPFVVCGHLLYGLIAFFDTGIVYARRSEYSAGLFVGAVAVNWLLNVWLLPRLGFIGAGVSLVLSMGALVTAIYFVSNRLWKIPMESRRLALSAVIFLVVLVTGTQIRLPGLPATIGIKATLVLLAGIAFYRLVLTPEEKNWLGRLGSQVRNWSGRGPGSTAA